MCWLKLPSTLSSVYLPVRAPAAAISILHLQTQQPHPKSLRAPRVPHLHRSARVSFLHTPLHERPSSARRSHLRRRPHGATRPHALRLHEAICSPMPPRPCSASPLRPTRSAPPVPLTPSAS
ncbi:hypothetical protein FA09DRAFT_74284 [Tilletiopsis washingtonensis]|uniref:Uncharacterized protein n=1 Tax=Tilletiopsis washingtonensis TaxID=58919 RepID=A0A316Z6N9_9BASI|nr:hypothetical protein FA09DRAFT_74284 [Tilletiopsis washingtonensis]PWN96956.1 hypothetical protein FA09DRAFT_74284 [Tilletiopsis washingtonensis]